jgi:DNA-binding IclR family transcriptional regulator
MKENNVRERLIETLKQHPEGLTILNISKILGINRFTASKYIYGLISEDIAYQRKVGPAKICCLKDG